MRRIGQTLNPDRPFRQPTPEVEQLVDHVAEVLRAKGRVTEDAALAVEMAASTPDPQLQARYLRRALDLAQKGDGT